MTNMGLPVPHGFTISTEACLTYLAEGRPPRGLMDEVAQHLEALESSMGKTLGDAGDLCSSAFARAPSSRCRG
jgi:pyruvate,orthophosphate dikinase